jgi:hypothetical protein
MDSKLEALSFIKDEMLMNKNVNARTIINAAKIAEEDNYLYELMIDWAKLIDDDIKNMLMEEVINYTEETIRKNKMNYER